MNKKKSLKNKDDSKVNNNISQLHITAYLDRIKSGLFIALLFILASELIMYFIVKSGILDLSVANAFIKSRWVPDISYIERLLIIQNSINWGIFFISVSFYNKVGFIGKKRLISATLMLVTTNYCFGHWGYIYLSIIYIIPVIFSCPLGKKYRLSVLISSIFLSVIYCFYQNALVKTGYHILIAVVSITALIATYLISGCIYVSFVKAIKDIEEYSKRSKQLYNEISHDFVTGAFSKAALNRDLTQQNDFNSIAFIDLDDFKEINDTMGHGTGDSVLQTLVGCCQEKQEHIYRYGGDEFIVLSTLSVKELAKQLYTIKNKHTNICLKLYKCNSTFSAGVMSLDKNSNLSDIETILNKSDKVMYIAKHNGKNQISIGA